MSGRRAQKRRAVHVDFRRRDQWYTQADYTRKQIPRAKRVAKRKAQKIARRLNR